MTDVKMVSRGRLWGEALGLAVIFFVAIVIAQVIGTLFYAFVLAEPGAIEADLANIELLSKIAVLSLPIGTIITLAAAFMLLKSRGVSWKDLGLRKPDSIQKTVLMGLGIFLVTAFVATLTNLGMSALGYEQDLSTFDFLPGDLLMFIFVLTIISWFSAGFAEEFVFRGFIMGNIARALGDTQKAWVVAALVQAGIFGMFHIYQGFNGVVATGVVALVFGLFYYKIRSLWPVIVAHGVMDVFGLSMLYYEVDIPI